MEWLQNGSRGDRVRELQQKLQGQGIDPGGVDGVFGPKTEAAVRRYQEQHGLQVDGIAGPETCGSLGMEGFEQAAAEEAAAEAPEAAQATEVRSKVISPAEDSAGAAKAEAAAEEAAAEQAADEAEDRAASAVEAMSGAMKATEDKVDEVAADAPKGFRAKIKAMMEERRARKGR